MTMSISGIVEHKMIRLSQARFLGNKSKILINAKIATPEKKCALSSIVNLQSTHDNQVESKKPSHPMLRAYFEQEKRTKSDARANAFNGQEPPY
jgi:hypothetical protein